MPYSYRPYVRTGLYKLGGYLVVSLVEHCMNIACIAHRTIAVGREKYSAGDYVLLHGTKREFICRLTGFVKNMTDGQATADIEWLYWPEEMTREIRNIPVKKRPTIPKCAPGEVFLSNCKDSVGIECIARKVQITPMALSSQVPQHCKQNQLYARWHWNITSKRFTPAKQESPGRKSFLSAVVETITLKDVEVKSPRRNQSKVPSGKFGSDITPDKALAKELTINLSRSPVRTSFLATISNRDPPAFQNMSSPLSSLRCEGSATRLKSKSAPQKPLSSSTKTPEPIAKWNSSSNVCTPKTNAELKTHCNQSEYPLPPTLIAGRTRRDRNRTGAGETGVKKKSVIPSSKRRSQLNTCDVVDLLSVDEEDEEEDELVECDQNQGMTEQRGCYTKEGGSSHDNSKVPEVAKPMTVGEERGLDCNQCNMDGEVKIPARGGGRGKEVGRSNGSSTKIPEDILSSPMKACAESVPPAEKKWSLRSKAEVKPPAYLAACPSILGATSGTKPPSWPNEERRVFTRKERKRERSTSPPPDLLVEEPLGKKFKQSGQKGMISNDGPKLRSGKRGWERDSEENASESEVVMKTPQGRVCSPRPHTIPRRKKRRPAGVEDHPMHADCDISNNDKVISLERSEGRQKREFERGRNLTQKRSRNQSKRDGKKSLYKTKRREDVDEDMGTGDEYQPSSDGESSDSTDSREEEEEEDDCFTPSSRKESSRKVLRRAIALVDNWSPEIDLKCRAGSTTSKVTKTPKTPRVSKISKTPTATPSGKTPRSRVVVTPHIPQKKTKAGKVKKSDFDKARMR